MHTQYRTALWLALIASASAQVLIAKPVGQSLTRVNFPDSLFVDCSDNEQPRNVRSKISYSEDGAWRAYVEVSVQGGSYCLETTRLWVARRAGRYRLVYMIPPTREHSGNGMQILGWARKSNLLLLRTELWQEASDAETWQQVLAVDTASGLIYEPRLDEIMEGRTGKQCTFRVIDAGLSSGSNLIVLVRTKIFTFVDEGDTESDVPADKRCDATEETWSFNFGTGEIKPLNKNETPQPINKFLFPPGGPAK